MIATMARRAAFIVAAVAAAACSSSGSTAAANGSTAAAPAQRHDRSIITSQELAESQANNLYDVVQRLHPEWLRGRNAASISGAGAVDVQIYYDTQRAGGTEVLRQMAPNSVVSMHYYSASESQARFGNGNLNGVIQLQMVIKR